MKPGYGFVIDIRVSQSLQNGAANAPHIEVLEDDTQTQLQLRLPDFGWITLGGERRAARFEVLTSADLVEQGAIEQASKGNLMYLATPAAFTNGWQSGQWPTSVPPIAAALNRFQLIGGWSLRPGDSGGENKSIRRCVPAGSIYFFDTSVSITQPLTEYGWQIGYGITYAGER
jgi:CRISPR-associated protein Cmr3